jgi:hypothetical protein
VTDPVNLRKRVRIRTLHPWEMGAAANLWATQYPEPLTEEQAARAIPMPAKLRVLLSNDYLKAVVTAVLIALVFFMWQLPVVMSRIPDEPTAAALKPHLAQAKEQMDQAEARNSALADGQRKLELRMTGVEVGLADYRSATDENFKRLFRMMEERRSARSVQ